MQYFFYVNKIIYMKEIPILSFIYISGTILASMKASFEYLYLLFDTRIDRLILRFLRKKVSVFMYINQ